jgi:fibronectin type 3 domain-containing protein
MPYSIFRMLEPGCTPTTPVLCNGFTWRRHLTILFLGALAVLMVACSSVESEPAGAMSTPDIGVAASGDDPTRSLNTAVLRWDAVTHPGLGGYRVYYSFESFKYIHELGKVIDVGDVTTHKIEGLTSGRRYYFAVTAYDADGRESESSNVVFKDIPN